MAMKLTALYMKVPEGYVAFIKELPGANTQGDTLDQACENLSEAVALVLEANSALAEQPLEGATRDLRATSGMKRIDPQMLIDSTPIPKP
jgi:predicted RNase H-like HicB family nuclease